jgi:hypothetical protein
MKINTTKNTYNYVDEKVQELTDLERKERFFTICSRIKREVNKTTKDIKEFIVNFLNDKTFEIAEIWNNLEDKDKASLFLHLAKLVMPRTPEIETEIKEPRVFEVVIVNSNDKRNLVEEN